MSNGFCFNRVAQTAESGAAKRLRRCPSFMTLLQMVAAAC